MPIKNDTERRRYYRERYHATREQALDYMAMKHAQAILQLIREHQHEPAPCQALASYLKEHCKFKPGMIK